MCAQILATAIALRNKIINDNKNDDDIDPDDEDPNAILRGDRLLADAIAKLTDYRKKTLT